MTIREVSTLNPSAVSVEVYVDSYKPRLGFHTDRIREVLDYSQDDKVTEWQLMDKEDYSNSVLANSSLSWEDCFKEDDKVLVIKIKR